MLFSMFPLLRIENLPTGPAIVTDIFRRVSMDPFKKNIVLLQEVTIPDGFTIEQVADKYYNRPDYHWVIMVINDIIDIRKEWPMSNSDLLSYSKKKYGETGIYETHHYRTVDDDKLIVDYDAADLANGDIEEVTNIQHEEELNDSKRQIKMLESKYLGEFVSIYSSMISGK